jgi:hypothetical protein
VKKLLVLVAVMCGAMAVPLIALLALVGVAATAVTCTPGLGGPLSSSAPVPAAARLWVAITHAACPLLPEPFIAAVMAQESGFRPDAYADDSNGGTWGLFQVNASIWQNAYGAPWSADLNVNGVWDVKDPEIHAAVGGKYLCGRLDGVRRIRAAHPVWASTRELSELDALVIAHNAGESRLESYPTIPAITAQFILNVRERMAAWSAADVAATPSPATSVAALPSTQASAAVEVGPVDSVCAGAPPQSSPTG